MDTKTAEIPQAWIEEHQRSLAFTEQLTTLTKNRTKCAADFQAEYRRLGHLLNVALSDVRTLLPILEAEMRHCEEEISEWTRRAMQAGAEEAAVLGAVALAHHAHSESGKVWAERAAADA